MSAPPRAELFVDGIAVLLQLMRDGLPPKRAGLAEVTVFEDLPDHLHDYLPVVKIQRTGGASDAPRFYDQFWCSFQVWSDRDGELDAHHAAWLLGRQVATVLYEAWEQQTLTPYGSINKWRESSGFKKFTDPELPHLGRYVAVYDLLIRNPRAPRTP